MELEFIQWLEQRWGNLPGIARGIGDDGAVIELPQPTQLVVATDMLIEGAHFRWGEHSAEQIGYKALGVNLSDLAAMGAKPLAAFVALALPRCSDPAPLARGIMQGMVPLAERFGCPIAGGDTNVAETSLSVAVTVLGTVGERGPLLRRGARPGDRIFVTGQLGGSLAGKHVSFEPRVHEALSLHECYNLHAAMDISDGLALDLSRLARQSGVGAIVVADRVPIAQAAQLMASADPTRTPLEHALGDGEDFELLLAVDPADAARMLQEAPLDCGLTDIGEFTAPPELLLQQADGERISLPITGYQHQ